MKKGWTTTKLIATGSLAVLDLILSLLGVSIVVVTGIPLSGVINAIVGPTMIVLTCLVINKFGAATIMLSIGSVLSISLPVLGAAGFWPKIVVSFVGGLISDVVYLVMKRNKLVTSIGVGAVSEIYFPSAVIAAGRIFNMPGVEAAMNFLSPLVLVGAVIGGTIGGYLGYLIYQKIKNTAVVKRIQGG